MQIGMVGLGKMGANMTTRLLRGGHTVVAFDRDPAAVARSAEGGASGAGSLETLVAQLAAPRAVWVMVPAGAPTEGTITDLVEHLAPGDVIVDGGNSNYQDTVRRAAACAARGVHLVDAGTSGGVWGLQEGYALMIGGTDDAIARLRPVFETLAPAADRGWAHVGPPGAGHFVKMVHNGIEYGMMQAYAEGFAILRHKPGFGDTAHQLDLAQIAEVWRHGSVVRSWLLDLTARALVENPAMEGIAPYVSDSGEGRWTVAEAIALDVPAPVITHALIARLRSRDSEGYADRLLAAMRNQFGGHAIKTEGGT
jgi:6-phosphogluconate dehydrogenase